MAGSVPSNSRIILRNTGSEKCSKTAADQMMVETSCTSGCTPFLSICTPKAGSVRTCFAQCWAGLVAGTDALLHCSQKAGNSRPVVNVHCATCFDRACQFTMRGECGIGKGGPGRSLLRWQLAAGPTSVSRSSRRSAVSSPSCVNAKAMQVQSCRAYSALLRWRSDRTAWIRGPGWCLSMPQAHTVLLTPCAMDPSWPQQGGRDRLDVTSTLARSMTSSEELFRHQLSELASVKAAGIDEAIAGARALCQHTRVV